MKEVKINRVTYLLSVLGKKQVKKCDNISKERHRHFNECENVFILINSNKTLNSDMANITLLMLATHFTAPSLTLLTQ